MAFRYLIYRTDYGNTIVRETPTDTSTGGTEVGLYSDFIIPEIQPLYLWRVTGATSVVPNTDQNINDWLEDIAPPPDPTDDASVGFVTGETATKIDKVTGAAGNLGTFNASGNLDDAGLTIAQLTGLTTYTFVESGGTTISQDGTTVTVYSAIPTGTTVNWGDITGTLSNQTDLQNALNAKLDVTAFNSYTGITDTRFDGIDSEIAYLSGQTDLKLNITDFASYTGATDTRIDTIETDIVYLSGQTDLKLNITDFDSYTGVTQPVIDAALTGVTNLGTGTTLGGTSARNVTIKSISVLGGLTISGDADNLVISGETNVAAVWGNITGTLANQTDLQNALDTKLDSSVFVNYTGVTDTRLDGIESDIVYLSGQTDLKLNITDFNAYTGTTDTRLDTIESDITGLTANKLDTTIFNSYTGTTETRLSGIEGDISSLSGETALAITGATNGLTKVGKNVELGGTLTKDTSINGSTFDFTINAADILIQGAGTGGVNIVDTDGTVGVKIESDGGAVELVGNTSLGAETTKVSVSDSQLLITDGRGTPVGFQYAADYSANFTNNSLITKSYADSIAQGLDLKESVKVATTSGETDIDLTGGTFGGVIDGYTLSDGDRVLIKNQDSAKEENGIYVYSSGGATFGRAIDFVNPNVTSGAFTFVETGTENAASGWVLVTQDPINVGTTLLDFTKFSEAGSFTAGTGIDISGNVISVDGATLAGNSISWTGNTFNVDISTGTLSTALADKLDVTAFNSYTGDTETRLTTIEGDISSLSGDTANKLETSIFNTYTGDTETRLTGIESEIDYISGVTDTKLDTSIFTGYTASTTPNEIFLTHTGGTELNTVAATAIEWDSAVISGTSFLWSGGTDIYIKEAGNYELNYNIPYNAQGAQSMAVGGNVILNNASVIDLTASAGFSTDNNAAGNLALPTVILTFAVDDKLTLAAFRTGRNGSTESSPTGSILIKKKNTLQ